MKKPVDPPTRDELIVDWLRAIVRTGSAHLSRRGAENAPEMPPEYEEAMAQLALFILEEALKRGVKKP